MSQNIPTNRMTDPTPVRRFRPTSRIPGPQGTVPLSTDFTEHLEQGGYPDFEQAGVEFAAMQRNQARQQDNRARMTNDPADAGELSAGSGTQDRWSGVAQPNEDS